MPRYAAVVVIAVLGAPAACVAADWSGMNYPDQLTLPDNILWPGEGHFPAWPTEPSSGKNVHAWAGIGVRHDSNLFRLSNSEDTEKTLGTSDKSDTVTQLEAGMHAAIPISQQQLVFDASVNNNHFNNFSFLNYTGYRAQGAWQWSLGSQWSGDIGYGRSQYLANLADLQAPIRDMITVDHAFAGARYALTPRWRVRGELDGSHYRHNDSSRSSLDSNVATGTFGVDYVSPITNFSGSPNTVGAQVKVTRSNFPNQQLVESSEVDNDYRQITVSAVADWQITGKSHIEGQLGYTTLHHDELSQRNFSGATGRLGYDWAVGAKTLLNVTAWREIQRYEDVASNYVLSRGISFGPSWSPTSKLVFQAKWLHDDRDYLGDPGFALQTGPQRKDTFHGTVVAAGYSPRRNTKLSMSWEHGIRDSNIFGKDYDYNAVSANVQLNF
jgi:exopolysaccharide biosynthesis operon protein EpsL